ncbi:MAG TPA: hypothetical protein VGH07_03305 [Chthoniobacterales bacterium]
MMRARLNDLVSIFAPIILLSGCASPSSNSSGPTPGFAQAENDQVIVAGAVLQAVVLDGNYYVRWNFSIRPKQANALSSIRIEDVTDPTPLLLVNDVAPQLDGGQWNETAGLMAASAASVHWLYEPNDTIRTFRFTFTGLDGRSDSLEQQIRYSQDAKNLVRATLKM